MRVFLDTNVIISAILSPSGIAATAYNRAVLFPNHAIMSELNVSELRSVFGRRFPEKLVYLEEFLATAFINIEIVSVPDAAVPEEEFVRDPTDRPILRAAIAGNADAFLTGDKDFLDTEVATPRILSPRQFLSELQ